jgi:phosphatidylinositol alpha 1,6-mannosyltransferase
MDPEYQGHKIPVMKILIISEVALCHINGVSNTLRKIIEYSRNPDHLLFIAAPKGLSAMPAFDNRNVVLKELSAAGLPFYPAVRLPVPWPGIIRNMFDEFKPDVVHLVDPFCFGAASGAYASKMGIPVLASFHTHLPAYTRYYSFTFLTGILWFLCRRAYRHAMLTLVPAMAIGKELTGKGIGPIAVWPRGVDINLFNPARYNRDLRSQLLGNRAFLVAYIGRIAREKNPDFIIRSMLPLKNVRLMMIGDGPLQQKLSREYAKQGILFKANLQGTELAEHYASSDLFVFASTTETYGQVLNEALASGLPVVYPSCTLLEEIYGPSGAAASYQPGNEHLLRRIVRQLLNDDSKRNSMRNMARMYVLGRTWDKATEQLFDLYSKLASGKCEELNGDTCTIR